MIQMERERKKNSALLIPTTVTRLLGGYIRRRFSFFSFTHKRIRSPPSSLVESGFFLNFDDSFSKFTFSLMTKIR